MLASIDIMGGKVVRLVRGDPSRARAYFEDAVEAVRYLKGLGLNDYHIVDLDAALGRGSNREQILRTISASGGFVEVAGGISTAEVAEAYIRAGASRVVVSTVAFTDLKEYSRIALLPHAVSVDFSGSEVMIRGWREQAGYTVEDALYYLSSLGAREFEATLVKNDGTMSGYEREAFLSIPERFRGSTLIAGGLGPEDHELALKDGFKGIIVGRALYRGLER